MDRLIHTALSGMRASMDSQRVIASNMANANTLGFRAEMLDQRAVTIEGQPNEARWSSISARKPSVLAFAILLAMTRWLSIDARMPESAVWMRRSMAIRSAG
ncbi:hypothetical protein A3726_07670 [Erythrobacter sp. HI0037]|nr:hypothetical protein A3726_07670 [Erythrobacter sp. HI0037]